jgi:O-phospho-L-seryl-tRNASec:L-selenocysteinyl-tRNA synthase
MERRSYTRDSLRRNTDLDIERKLLDLVPESMAARGRITLEALLAPIADVLNRRVFPERSLSDFQVELMLQLLSSMDSDKDPEAARVGEREGRTASPLVSRLSAGFNHGVGRSGHLIASQPKATGASLMQQVTDSIAVDAIRKLGLGNIHDGLVTPLSTGMSIALVMAALRRETGVRKVLYPRIDHLSPSRGIALAGLEEVGVPTVLHGDAVDADVGELERLMTKHKSSVVLLTTTFFPPRQTDPVKEVAKLCADKGTPLVINNAYGIQSEDVMQNIHSAIDAGRVDAVVQSSDKNFLAPVGGSIVVSPSKEIVDWIAETYAGRASAGPIVQTLAALLVTGVERYNQLRREQTANRLLLQEGIERVAGEIGQRVLTVKNPVSCAMTLDGLDAENVGASLYNLRVTGPRAISKGTQGSCIDNYPHSYIVMNAAIGASKKDVEEATSKLNRALGSSSPKL